MLVEYINMDWASHTNQMEQMNVVLKRATLSNVTEIKNDMYCTFLCIIVQ